MKEEEGGDRKIFLIVWVISGVIAYIIFAMGYTFFVIIGWAVLSLILQKLGFFNRYFKNDTESDDARELELAAKIVDMTINEGTRTYTDEERTRMIQKTLVELIKKGEA